MGWIGKHWGKALILVLLLGAVFFFWLKAMEKSESVLFNQLIAIMEENVPVLQTDVTDIVCVLVTEDRLIDMMSDSIARSKTVYLEQSTDTRSKPGDREWKIKISGWKSKNDFSSSTLFLIIRINQFNDECRAKLWRLANVI